MCFVESVVFSHIVFLQNLLHISYRIDHILSGSDNNVNLFSSCVSAEILRQEVDSRIGHIVTGNKIFGEDQLATDNVCTDHLVLSLE